MNITILTPEEEIIAYMEKAIEEELPEIIQEINENHGETWIEGLNEIARTEGKSTTLPNAVMSINKVKKETVDINFTKAEYILTMTINFRDNENRITGYRYNYLINRLIKTSSNIENIADSIIIEEMEYRQNKRNDKREPAAIVLKIIITRETT